MITLKPEDVSFPEDLALVFALARIAAEWLRAEGARTGLSEAQIIEKAGVAFDSNDKEMKAFLDSLKTKDL